MLDGVKGPRRNQDRKALQGPCVNSIGANECAAVIITQPKTQKATECVFVAPVLADKFWRKGDFKGYFTS